MMQALTQVLGLLTVEQWIQLIVALPSLIEAARKAGEDLHPALVELARILDETKAAGASDDEAAEQAAQVMPGLMPGLMAELARNNDAAIALQPGVDPR